MNKEEIMNQVCNCFKMNITLNELEKIIDDLQKKAELGETYKKLYGEVKKQKDDVVEYIKYQLSNFDFEKDIKARMLASMIIVMLEKGEIDD